MYPMVNLVLMFSLTMPFILDLFQQIQRLYYFKLDYFAFRNSA